jgi:hypothetical protein
VKNLRINLDDTNHARLYALKEQLGTSIAHLVRRGIQLVIQEKERELKLIKEAQ